MQGSEDKRSRLSYESAETNGNGMNCAAHNQMDVCIDKKERFPCVFKWFTNFLLLSLRQLDHPVFIQILFLIYFITFALLEPYRPTPLLYCISTYYFQSYAGPVL